VPSGRRRARRNVQGKSDRLPSGDQCRPVMQLDSSWRGGALNNHTWLRRGDLAGLVSVQASQLWDNFRVVIITSGPVDLNSQWDQGATNSGRSPETFISHRDLTASVHDHETTELEMFVFLILCPNLPSAPSLAVFPAGASQSLARFVRWCFTTWPTSWWLQQSGPGT